MKSIVRIVLPSVVQSEFYDADENTFCTQRKFKMAFSNGSSPLCLSRQRSAIILEIIHWTQTVYALLYPPQHKDALFHVYLRFDLNENEKSF